MNPPPAAPAIAGTRASARSFGLALLLGAGCVSLSGCVALKRMLLLNDSGEDVRAVVGGETRRIPDGSVAKLKFGAYSTLRIEFADRTAEIPLRDAALSFPPKFAAGVWGGKVGLRLDERGCLHARDIRGSREDAGREPPSQPPRFPICPERRAASSE